MNLVYKCIAGATGVSIGTGLLLFHDFINMINKEKNGNITTSTSDWPYTDKSHNKFLLYSYNNGLINNSIRPDNSICLKSDNPTNELYDKLSGTSGWFYPSFCKHKVINMFIKYSSKKYNIISTPIFHSDMKKYLALGEKLQCADNKWNYVILGKNYHFNPYKYKNIVPVQIKNNKMVYLSESEIDENPVGNIDILYDYNKPDKSTIDVYTKKSS
jgi:hypothetical protein